MKPLEKFRAYFLLNNREWKSFWALVVLIIILSFVWYLVNYIFVNHEPPANAIAVYDTQVAKDACIAQADDKRNKIENSSAELIHLFPFNPNIVSADSLALLGLPKYVVNNIVKYRSKGGRFRDAQAFSKVYGLKPDMYKKLEAYIQIIAAKEGSRVSANYTTENKADDRKLLVDLNTTDSIGLLKVKGLGPYRGAKILRYRRQLGGYINTAQVLEIKGFDTIISVQNIVNQLVVVNTRNIERININAVDAKTLSKHPYFWGKYKIAQAIIAYRNQHGNYTQVSDLKNVVLLDEATYTKVLPYLSVN